MVLRDPRWAGPWPNDPTGRIEPILGEAFRVVPESAIPAAWPRPEV
jgi:hypothetical protein